ncbi:BPL-N domain-containing protein [Bremerella sp. JC770]|uniref:BPL-N domain-containing protein n=1 Tax=Bremerella sp. JC770 TaxID=3232137 RepID=UPI003459524A
MLSSQIVTKLSTLPIFGVFSLLLLTVSSAQAQTNVVTENAPLIRVAIYEHGNGTASGPKNLTRILSEEKGFVATVVSPEQIREGILDQCDVLIMPGGSGSKQAKMLEDEGREVVRNYVNSGGGYVGICAGSYLASSHYSWSLGLINAKVWDRSHWARGTGTVSLDISPAGCKILDVEEGELDCYYGQGPLIVPNDDPSLPGYEVLATYATEVAKKGAPKGAMVGTHAIVRTMYGQGRVICFSPHPEKSGGPNAIMAEGVRWAGSGQVK